MVLVKFRTARGRARIVATHGGRPGGKALIGRLRQDSALVPNRGAIGPEAVRAEPEAQLARAVHAGSDPFIPGTAMQPRAMKPCGGNRRRPGTGAKGSVALTMGRTWAACSTVSRRSRSRGRRDRSSGRATHFQSQSSIGAAGSDAQAAEKAAAARTPPVSRSASRIVELGTSALPGPDMPLPAPRVPAGPGAR